MAIEKLTETVLARVTLSEGDKLEMIVKQRETTVSRIIRAYIRRLRIK